MALVAVAVSGCEKLLSLTPVVAHNQSPRALVFSGFIGTSELSDFPLLVQLDDTVIDYAQVVDPSRDLRFHDEPSDQDLPFEVERWDPNGTSVVWVRVPLIHQPTDRILMYFGADAGGSAMPKAVWSDYDLVFHGDAMVDATGHTSPIAVNDIPPPAPGVIGNAVALSGIVGQGVDFQNSADLFASWPAFTLELWVEPQYMPDPYNLGASGTNPNDARIIDQPLGGVQGGAILNSVTDKPSAFEWHAAFAFTTSASEYTSFYLPDNIWSQVTFSYDGQTLWSYRDGVVLDLYATDQPDTSQPSTYDLFLGTNGGGLPIKGEIDEVRLSQTYRGPDWVGTQYLSMAGRLVTFEDP